MSKKILTLQKPSQETNENMGKDIPIATKKTLNIKSDKEKKTEKLKQLSEWIGDITQTERQQKETAKKISEALQKIVDMQNNEATGYQKNFDIWLGEKMEHKIRKQYFPGKNKEEILLLAKNDENIQNKFKEYTKACQIKNEIWINNNEKRDIFTAIKRTFNKNISGHKGSDIDKEAGKKLLSIARFFTNEKGEKTSYTEYEVDHDERAKTWLQYDSWGTRNGMEIIPNRQTITNGKSKGETYLSLFNALAILDEHDRSEEAKNQPKPTSSTQIIYTLLKKLGVFHKKHEKQIKRFVDFVDKVDSLYYQVGGMDQSAKKRTLFHNHKLVDIEKIYAYFEDENNTGFEVLDEKTLKNLGIQNNTYNEKRDQKNIQKLQDLENKWRIGKIDNLKFIFAVGKEFTWGQEIVSYYQSWIVQLFESGDLYIYNPFPLPKKIWGFPTNGHFLIIKDISAKDLEKILDSFEFHEKYSDPLLKKTFLDQKKSITNKKSMETV